MPPDLYLPPPQSVEADGVIEQCTKLFPEGIVITDDKQRGQLFEPSALFSPTRRLARYLQEEQRQFNTTERIAGFTT